MMVYADLTAADLRRMFKLPDDYTVNGLIVHGAASQTKSVPWLTRGLVDSGVEYEVRSPLVGHVDGVIEVTTDQGRFWYVTSFGGALAAETAHLACLFGSRVNLVIGTCGSLVTRLKAGDVIIPWAVEANESTTRPYALNPTNRFTADVALARDLEKAVLNQGSTVYRGLTTTHQAIFTETAADLRRWAERGCLAVEMEAASVLAPSAWFSVPAAAVFIVADEVANQVTFASPAYHDGREARERAMAAVYQAVLQTGLGLEGV